MFGTANLDMRSLWLNHEVTLFIYGPEFAQALRALQQTYLAQSIPIDPATWGTLKEVLTLANRVLVPDFDDSGRPVTNAASDAA